MGDTLDKLKTLKEGFVAVIKMATPSGLIQVIKDKLTKK